MVRQLVSSGAGLEVVVGKAGAGKTLALAAARQVWEDSGHRVLGAALSARAARGLEDGAGISSETLARVLARLSSRALELEPRDVVVLDEAGLVGTRHLSALVGAADAAGAKLVLVGDPRQLPEIEAGGALGALARRLGAIELTENRRQHEPWERFALDALRLGRAEVALATYEQAGRVHTAPTIAVTRTRLVERWAGSFLAGHDAVMLAVGRAEVAELNALARVALRQSGRLGPDVLECDSVGFAVGDRVVCLRNDRRVGVTNGTLGLVERAVGSGLAVKTGDGICVLPASYLEAGHLGHGYTLTVYKAQGVTVDRAFVLSSESLTREAGYVAMSRARESTELFVSVRSDPDEVAHDPRRTGEVDPLDELRRRLGTSRAKGFAIDELETAASFNGGRAEGGRTPSAATGVERENQPHALYRDPRGGRGVGDATAMGAQELNEDTGTADSGSDPVQRVHQRQRRLAEDLARRGFVREIEPGSRSLGLER